METVIALIVVVLSGGVLAWIFKQSGKSVAKSEERQRKQARLDERAQQAKEDVEVLRRRRAERLAAQIADEERAARLAQKADEFVDIIEEARENQRKREEEGQ